MYSHEQLKLMDAAAISISSQRHIQSVIEELIETALAATPTPAEPPADLVRYAARYRWLLNQAWFQQAADRFDFTDGGMQNRFEKCMDEFIDAAMSEKGQS